MKKKVLFVLLIIGLAAMVSAQDGSRRDRERPTSRSSARETVRISGAMVVANGMPALKSGEDTYIISGISRLIGFVDGLKEGAQVTVEGLVVTFPWRNSLKYLQATKLTLGGNSYDLSPSFGMGTGMMMGMGMWNFAPNGQFSTPNVPRAPMMNWMPNIPGAPMMRNQSPRTPQRR